MEREVGGLGRGERGRGTGVFWDKQEQTVREGKKEKTGIGNIIRQGGTNASQASHLSKFQMEIFGCISILLI